ncbi:tereporin-Ca1-like [Paramacrobiotus metropolitanus]|uniref:tereporin-Ca1-like n=1 Tax=Paramacrobiotus metropolitanus TaxID=2943436 RepID=UPI00244600BF|nr:tereporin-Ca1-like [Paramacrobiotus metropolitanus]XP_055350920.1 tereporin-Ca1-like [Paramacrobiotus metropolitanus]XP_055350921.1 tereporin-Ca1-like [Paramacrobiotus metropolitanus]XP_055350922.1 tereporin-Ca1-like [Paramacrobiotus metropolitanus]
MEMAAIGNADANPAVDSALGSQNASQSSYRVAGTLKVVNNTRWMLQLEKCYINYGKVEAIFDQVRPGQSAVMKVHKTSYLATGSSGTLAWTVVNENKSIVVMWSLPFNHDFSHNVLAVGIRSNNGNNENNGNTSNTFREMYSENEQSYFRRKEFYSVIDPVEHMDNRVKVRGRMGNAHKTDIIIDVHAINPADQFGYVQDGLM